tara:strand:- start:2576 stop:3388 length:813 start_codon:yes stop_codon:yes gene_type:complete
MEKAKTLQADTIVMDLEDAVAPDQKAVARQQVVSAVNQGGYGYRELVIRVNGIDTPWFQEDVMAVATTCARAICLPKIESAQQIEQVVEALDAAGAAPDMEIWAMIETPKGVQQVNAIAAAHPRLSLLMMGTSDLAKEMRIPHTADRLGFITSLSLCVLAARAGGLDILDGVHLALDDEAGLRALCEQAKQLGFDGKTLIHPKQIDTANQVFAPDAAEVDRARRIIAAFEQAESEGKGVAVVDGKLVENLHVEEATRTLAIQEAILSSQQ